MSGTTDDRYLEWLYSHIGSVRNRNPERTYWSLAKELMSREFVWFVPNDGNRVKDGTDLRYEFIEETGERPDPAWMDLGCSMLEMLIALSRRASFETGEEPAKWFWRFIANLGLTEFTDSHFTTVAGLAVNDAMDAVIYRTYDHTGAGGLFPLREATEDQRRVEIWYQMAAYLTENTTLLR
jgi:hypothetical protein